MDISYKVLTSKLPVAESYKDSTNDTNCFSTKSHNPKCKG